MPDHIAAQEKLMRLVPITFEVLTDSLLQTNFGKDIFQVRETIKMAPYLCMSPSRHTHLFAPPQYQTKIGLGDSAQWSRQGSDFTAKKMARFQQDPCSFQPPDLSRDMPALQPAHPKENLLKVLERVGSWRSSNMPSK